MKIIILSAFISVSSVAIAHDNVSLKVGESAYFGSTKVTCSGSANISVLDAYKSLPYAHKLNILKGPGIGSCYVKVISGNTNFFHSDRFVNGIHLNSQSRYLVDQALKDGDCSL